MSQGFKFTFFAAASWAIAIILTKFIFRLGENPYNLAFWTSLLGAPYMLYLLMRSIKDLKNLKLKII